MTWLPSHYLFAPFYVHSFVSVKFNERVAAWLICIDSLITGSRSRWCRIRLKRCRCHANFSHGFVVRLGMKEEDDDEGNLCDIFSNSCKLRLYFLQTSFHAIIFMIWDVILYIWWNVMMRNIRKLCFKILICFIIFLNWSEC